MPGEADPNWDSWAFWLPKAKSTYYFHGLDSGPGGFTHFANRDYPPLAPALEATNFHFIGQCGGRPSTSPSTGSRQSHSSARWPRCSPLVFRRESSGRAWRLSCSCRASASTRARPCPTRRSGDPHRPGRGVRGAVVLFEGRPAYAVLVVLLATAAALLKNEGLLYGLSISVVVAVVAWRDGRRLLSCVLIASPILALVPWKIWLLAHGLPMSSQYYGVGDLGPAHLVSAHGRLGTAIVRLSSYLVSPKRWLLVVPVSAVAAAVALWRRPALGALLSCFVLLSMAGLVVIYWIGNIPIDFWLDSFWRTNRDGDRDGLRSIVPPACRRSLRRDP